MSWFVVLWLYVFATLVIYSFEAEHGEMFWRDRLAVLLWPFTVPANIVMWGWEAFR